MKLALLGAGIQAQAAAFDLIGQKDVSEVLVADSDLDRAVALAGRWGDPRLTPVRLDAADEDAAAALLTGVSAALSAVPYRFNAGLARAAVRAKCNFCDLGGNNTVVAEELALHEAAREAGVTIVPDCGLAPGMVAPLTAHAVSSMDTTDSVEIRVGGLPRERGGILDYSLFFNIQGLINEYVEPVVALEAGEIVTLGPLAHLETLEFPAPFGTLEAFTTSGGTSTLPETYRGKVNRLNYKTIRYPGHGRVFRAMYELGLLRSDAVEVDGARVIPRNVFAAVAGPVLDRGLKDVVLVRITAQGTRGGKPVTRVYQMIDYGDDARGLTAMMRTTAFPATVVQLMLARGEVAAKGALPQERCLDPERFLTQLRERGLKVEITEHVG